MAGADDLSQSIRRLRVVRSFLPDPVSPDDMAAVLEAGRWTGSSKNDQAWAVVVVDDPERRKELAATGRYADPIVTAPAAVAVVRLPAGNDFDQGRLAQNLMLAAAGRGLGSCPVTLHDDTAAAKVLGLPSAHRVRWAIAIGHPAGTTRPFSGGGRKPLSDFAYSDRFGLPWQPN